MPLCAKASSSLISLSETVSCHSQMITSWRALMLKISQVDCWKLRHVVPWPTIMSPGLCIGASLANMKDGGLKCTCQSGAFIKAGDHSDRDQLASPSTHQPTLEEFSQCSATLKCIKPWQKFVRYLALKGIGKSRLASMSKKNCCETKTSNDLLLVSQTRKRSTSLQGANPQPGLAESHGRTH